MGKLIPGALADVIVVDYDPPTPMYDAKIDSHILFGVSGRSVDTTIIGRRVVMQDRELLAIDEPDIIAKARMAAATLWQRFNASRDGSKPPSEERTPGSNPNGTQVVF